MKTFLLTILCCVSTLAGAQENSFSQQDSIMLLSQLKDKSFKIDKRVTVDCIPSIDMHHSTTYSRAKVKKVFLMSFSIENSKKKILSCAIIQLWIITLHRKQSINFMVLF